MRSTAASSSGAPSSMNRVTMWPGPYRCLISAMRSSAATGSPSGDVVRSQYHSASRSTPLSSGKAPTWGRARVAPLPRSRKSGGLPDSRCALGHLGSPDAGHRPADGTQCPQRWGRTRCHAATPQPPGPHPMPETLPPVTPDRRHPAHAPSAGATPPPKVPAPSPEPGSPSSRRKPTQPGGVRTKHERCRVEPYLIKAAPHGGAAGPASAPRAQPWEARPGARRAARQRHVDQGWIIPTLARVLRGSVFLAPDCPARDHRVNGGPKGPSQAIGYADH